MKKYIIALSFILFSFFSYVIIANAVDDTTATGEITIVTNPLDCTNNPWGTVTNGTSKTGYATASVDYPSSCVSETRTCTSGSLSGTYPNTSCTVKPVAPTVTTTTPITNITTTSAVGGGTLISNGGATITDAGLLWCIGSPCTDYPQLDYDNYDGLSNVEMVGNTWTSTMTILTPNTTYTTRAYAINGSGIVGLGNVVSFTTKKDMSGSLTASPNPCTIVAGNSTCDINLAWSIANPIGSTTSITAGGFNNRDVSYSTTPASQSGDEDFSIPEGSTTFYLYNNGVELGSVTVIATKPALPNPDLVIFYTNFIPDYSKSGTTNYGASYTVSWGPVDNATSCTLNGVNVSKNGGTSSGEALNFINNTKSFILSCTGLGGTATSTVTINYPPKPTGLTSSCSTDSLTGEFKWSAPDGYDTFYTRVSSDGVELTSSNGYDDNFTGTSKTFTTTPGKDYSAWIHSRHPNGAYSDSISTWFNCPVIIVDPTVTTTTPVTNITTNSAIGGGTTVSGGGATVVEAGLIWSIGTTSNLDLDNYDGISSDGWASGGPWTSTMNSLISDTNYTVRAYAKNSAERVGLGDPVYFKTKIPNTVTFDGNGHTSGSTPTQYIISGNSAYLNNNGFFKEYHNFNGWNTSPDGSGTSYPNQSYYPMGSSNVILYAQWILSSCPTPLEQLVTVPCDRDQYGNSATSGEVTRTHYKSSAPSCSFETPVTIYNSTYVSDTCVYPCANTPWGTIASGSSVTAYSTSSVDYPASCISQTRTCTNKNLSGAYPNTSCTVNSVAPTVITTTPITNITTTSAVGGGSVTSNGGATVIEAGIVWSKSINPTIALSTKTSHMYWADYSSWSDTMTGLTEGTTYYVRAYAKNKDSNGNSNVGYGNNVSFTTLSDLGCTGTPWNYMTNGSSKTAYATDSVDYPASCISQTRTCTNKVLSGTYINTSCIVKSVEPTVITTNPVPTASITTNSAVGGGTTVSGGGADVILAGLIWCIGDNCDPYLDKDYYYENMSYDGWAIGGPWTSSMDYLNSDTTYTVVAYAINKDSNSIFRVGYGNKVTFKTDPIYNLTISKTGTGTGTVNNSPIGASCGSNCFSYEKDTIVTLTATPSADSIFDGWSGGCNQSGQVTMTSSKNCIATFTKIAIGVTSASTFYNITNNNTSVSFAYTTTTNMEEPPECTLLDYNQDEINGIYKQSSPIIHLTPQNFGSYGYFIKCRDTVKNNIFVISENIAVNVIGVSVTADTPYNKTPGENVSFSYFATTNPLILLGMNPSLINGTKCKLLDFESKELVPASIYQTASPIQYTIPKVIDSLGYHIKCENTLLSIASNISNLIVVNTACPLNTKWDGASCVVPTGTLSASLTTCTILSGRSSCTSQVSLNWSVQNPITSPVAITSYGMDNINVTYTLTTPQSGIEKVTISNKGPHTFYLYNNAVQLKNSVGVNAEATVTANCESGTAWDEGKKICEPPTGTISATPCTIKVDESSCPSTISWSVTNPIDVKAFIIKNISKVNILTTSNENPGSYSYTLNKGDEIFELWHNDVLLEDGEGKEARITAIARCADKTEWNTIEGKCKLKNPEIISFTANPHVIFKDSSSTLSWEVDADLSTGCTGSGEGFTGHKDMKGTLPVSPSNTTKYTLTCTRDGATPAVKTVEVKVVDMKVKEN